jgi:amino acid permease
MGGPSNPYTNSGQGARLLAVWYVFYLAHLAGCDYIEVPAYRTGVTYTTFSFISGATISIAAAEARHQGQDLKSANRKTFLRLVCLYMFAIFLVSFNVPYDHKNLLPFNTTEQLSGSNSPFIIAMAEAGLFGLANVTNGYFIFAAWSCTLSNMYSASRTLYSLALNQYMPEFGGLREKLATTTHRGVPLNSIIACTLFGFLAALSLGDKPQAPKVLSIPQDMFRYVTDCKGTGCTVSCWHDVLDHNVFGSQLYIPALLSLVKHAHQPCYLPSH